MQHLFTEFDVTTASQWKEQLVKDLKGTDYSTLVWKTHSGFDVQPFYTAEDLATKQEPVFSNPDWAICEFIRVENAREANTLALHALQNGASGIVFQLAAAVDYAALVKDISLPHIYSLFIVAPHVKEELSVFLQTLDTGNSCFIESDGIPLGDEPAKSTRQICLDATSYQEGGANAVNELACTLGQLNEYMTGADAVLPETVHLRVSVGGDFFMEIAKLRALRKLSAFLLSQYSCQATIHLHAQTTFVNKSSADRYNNMLRSATEAMSAALGGANSITIFPFDMGFETPNAFSARMARNQQLILKDESYLNMVADIPAGSYYLETLTEELCQRAWEVFKHIETKGGLLACLKSGEIGKLVSTDAEQLIDAFRNGSLVLVGVNKFQNKQEATPSHRQIATNITTIIKPIRLENFARQQEATLS